MLSDLQRREGSAEPVACMSKEEDSSTELVAFMSKEEDSSISPQQARLPLLAAGSVSHPAAGQGLPDETQLPFRWGRKHVAHPAAGTPPSREAQAGPGTNRLSWRMPGLILPLR